MTAEGAWGERVVKWLVYSTLFSLVIPGHAPSLQRLNAMQLKNKH